MTRNHIGVDLCKDALDVFDPCRGETRILNQPKAIARWAARLGPDDVVVFEATSGCDRPVRAGLEAAGRDFVRLNPLHVWHFARSLNLAKTDRVDARMLARLGAERQPAPDPYGDPVREELRALSQRRDQLKRMIAQEKNRLGDAGHPLALRDIRAGIAGLERRLAAFDKAIAAHIARHPALAEDAGLLRSIPGIGPVAATEILAHLPEAGRVDRREVASLAGLAPRAHELGQVPGQAPARRRAAPPAPGHVHGGAERAAPPRLPVGLRRAHEGRQEAGEGHPHGGGAAAAGDRQRHASQPDPLQAPGTNAA